MSVSVNTIGQSKTPAVRLNDSGPNPKNEKDYTDEFSKDGIRNKKAC